MRRHMHMMRIRLVKLKVKLKVLMSQVLNLPVVNQKKVVKQLGNLQLSKLKPLVVVAMGGKLKLKLSRPSPSR